MALSYRDTALYYEALEDNQMWNEERVDIGELGVEVGGNAYALRVKGIRS